MAQHMDYSLLNSIFLMVKRGFVYRRETQTDVFDDWQMPPIDYDGKARIVGDCDEFCLAVRFLLEKRGIPSRLVACINDVPEPHLVVEVHGWIFDNTKNRVTSNMLLRRYRWLAISGFNPGDPWRLIKPFSEKVLVF